MKISLALVAVIYIAGLAAGQSLPEIMVGKVSRYVWLDEEQKRNARIIMDECVRYTTNDKQLAYILSTAIGECSLRPVREWRAPEGSQLWHIQNAYWYSGYFGRGYVQITWIYNYQRFGQLLNIDLVNNPDLALAPDAGAKIMCIGMTQGLFTGKGLNDFLGDGRDDWNGARTIVNGWDKAAEFGERGRAILNA